MFTHVHVYLLFISIPHYSNDWAEIVWRDHKNGDVTQDATPSTAF